MSCMYSRVWSTKKGKTFPLDSVEKGLLEGIWEGLFAQTTELRGGY